jgi:hypothetical protein
MNRGVQSDPSFIGSFKRFPMKKEATSKNAKGLIQKTSEEKRGNSKKIQRGSFKRPPMKKYASPKNTKGLIQKTSDEKRGNPQKHKVAHSKDL